MGRFTYLKRNLEQLVFRNRDQHKIPTMDGVMTPNNLLDALEEVGGPVPGADDVALGPEGTLFLTAGNEVLKLGGPHFENRSVFMNFESETGGLTFHPDGRLLVCVSGEGLASINLDGSVTWLTSVENEALGCLTAVTAASDGSIYLTDGSRTNRSADWKRDLMELNASGRLVRCSSSLTDSEVLADGLHFPNGLCLSSDHKEVWFTQSWNHSLSRIEAGGISTGKITTVIDNLPAYPARMSPAKDGGFWIALFAVRTHLTELILLEDDYRKEMMRSIPVNYWPGPELRSTSDCMEPMQFGNIITLGVKKPWAPARSYGLVIRVGRNGEPMESLHSRRGGLNHGICSVLETDMYLFAVSKGRGQLLCKILGRSDERN